MSLGLVQNKHEGSLIEHFSKPQKKVVVISKENREERVHHSKGCSGESGNANRSCEMETQFLWLVGVNECKIVKFVCLSFLISV